MKKSFNIAGPCHPNEYYEFDVSRDILFTHVEQAAQTLIMRRDTHIDSLMERLKEARVQRIVEPVIFGEIESYDLLDDDYQYVLDLGLLKEFAEQLAPSNPIYGKVIIRTLSYRSQMDTKHHDHQIVGC